MNSSERKSLDLSIQVYRQLIRVYPKGFLNQFEEQLVQAFGDVSRRAFHAGGMLRLILLWMRILPDLGVSAIREHFSASAWLCPPHVRLRWIVACTFGFGLGSFIGDGWTWLGTPYNGPVRSLCIVLVLGLLQSAWALKRPPVDVLRWTAATAVGMFVLALPFRFFADGLPPNRLSLTNEILFAALCGAGIGLLQFFVLPKGALKSWRWIPANALAAAGSFGVSFLYLTSSHYLRFELSAFLVGAVFGCLTCLPLRSILDRREIAGVEGAVES